MFIASFRTIDHAIASVEKVKSGATIYWQVVDKSNSQIVAEDMSHFDPMHAGGLET